jgi:hypothetical protein
VLRAASLTIMSVHTYRRNLTRQKAPSSLYLIVIRKYNGGSI